MKNIGKIIALLLFFGLLQACHTVSGAGQDISATGHAISRAAS